MSFQKTIVLAMILIAALGYVFWIEMPHQKEISKKDYALRDLVPEEIERIEIAKPDGSFELKNTEVKGVPLESKEVSSPLGVASDAFKKWELSSVKGSELDSATMNGLITALTELKLENAIPPEDIESDLSVYGLKEPALILRVKTLQQAREFQFGKLSSYLNKRYVKVGDGKDIFLITDNLFNATNKTASDFRDKTPIDFSDTEIKSVSIVGGKDILKFEIDSEKKWRVIEPVHALASATAISEMNRTLRNLRVKDFIDDTSALKNYALDNPNLKVSLQFSEESKRLPLELSISSQKIKKEDGSQEDLVYLYNQGAPSIYSLTTNPYDLLVKPADNYREKALFKFATDRVLKVTTEGEAALVVTRATQDKWKVNDKEGDTIFIDQWLADLSLLEAKAFPVETKNFGFEKPKFKVSLELEPSSGENKNANLFLVIGGEASIGQDSKGYYAYVNEPKDVFIIGSDSFKKISLKEEALVKPAATPTALPSSTIITPAAISTGEIQTERVN